MLFAQTHQEALVALTPSSFSSAVVDALLDALFLVPLGENTCGDEYTGVAGPGGEWAVGRDDGCPLPPWLLPVDLCCA